MRRVLPVVLALLTAFGAAGCPRSSEPTYYALAPTPGQVWNSPLQRVKVLRVGLAGYLDRGTIVRRIVDHRLDLAAGEHWAEPLGSMLMLTLAQNLAMRLPSTGVFTEGAGVQVEPDAVVYVRLERLDMVGDRVVLRAQFSVQLPGQEPSQPARVELSQEPRTSSVSALVGAENQLLGMLADQVARRLSGEARLK